ncbi:MAG: helix-turn-helix domain-containing protein [Candidatus Flexifilum sp.]
MKPANVFRYSALGEKITRSLQKSGLSPSELARLLFVSRSVVSEYLAGKKRPEHTRLGWMAAILNVEPLEFSSLAEPDPDSEFHEQVKQSYLRFKYGMGTLDEFLSQQEKNIHRSEIMRDSGAYRNANDMIDEVIRDVENRLKFEKRSSTVRSLLELKLRALDLKVETTIVLEDRTRAYNASIPFIQDGLEISKKLKSDVFSGIFHGWACDGLYRSGRFQCAIERASELMNSTNYSMHCAQLQR